MLGWNNYPTNLVGGYHATVVYPFKIYIQESQIYENRKHVFMTFNPNHKNIYDKQNHGVNQDISRTSKILVSILTNMRIWVSVMIIRNVLWFYESLRFGATIKPTLQGLVGSDKLPVVKMPLKTEIYHFEMMDLHNNHSFKPMWASRGGLKITI